MRPILPRNYNSIDMTAALVSWTDPAPPATAALINQADSWPVLAAVSPYAGCGHVFDGLTEAGLFDRYLAAVIAPGAVHGRAALSRRWSTEVGAAWAQYHELWSTDGGTTGNNIVRVPKALIGAIGYHPIQYFQSGAGDIVTSGGGISDSPTTPEDRQLELQTLAVPYVEPLYVSEAAGFALCVTDQIQDLESL